MIVYQHRRLDTNEIFYVGIGKTKKRAYSKHQRNKQWKHIVNKYGRSVEIVCTCDTWEEACHIEQYLIKFYGRRDLGLGPLVNFTDGGEGTINYRHTDEAKKKMSESKKGVSINKGRILSEEHKLKLSKAHTGKKHSEEHIKKRKDSRKGYRHSEEAKKKLSKAHTGKFVSEETKIRISEGGVGNKNAKCYIVLDTQTGVFYNSIKEASYYYNISNALLGKYLSGKLKNKTNLIKI